MNKLYYCDSLINEECFNELGIKVFSSDKYECENYVDDDELCNIINDIIEKIEDSDVCKKLGDIGIYLKIDYSIDKTIWNDNDDIYINW